MQKIKVRLPATVVNLGSGLHTIGLALNLYTTIDVSPRSDEQLIVEPQGEGAGRYSVAWRHPVVLALSRLFQHLERAPLGLNIRIDNQIPIASGLGAETAFFLAGVIAGNNLMGAPLNRHELLTFASQISRADATVSAMMGGLCISHLEDERLIYRNLPLEHAWKITVILPELDRYSRPTMPDTVPLQRVLSSISRSALLIEALRTGDLELLTDALGDAILTPRVVPLIRGYNEAVNAAYDVGGVAVTTASEGPSLLVFSEDNHDAIGNEMVDAFEYVGVKARYFVLSVDTQGVVISVMQSS